MDSGGLASTTTIEKYIWENKLTKAQEMIKKYYDAFKKISENKPYSFKDHHKNEIMKLSGYLCSKYCKQGNFGYAEDHFYDVGANASNITNFMFLAKLAALLADSNQGYDKSLFVNALEYMDHAYSKFKHLIPTQKIKSEEDFQFKFQMCKDIPNTFFEDQSLLALDKDHALLQLGFTLLSSNLENSEEKVKNILNEFSARLETGYCRDLLELKSIINDENCDLDVLNDLIFRLTNPKPNAQSLIDTDIIQRKLLNVVGTLLEKKYLSQAYDLSKTLQRTFKYDLFSLEYLNKGSNEDIANKFLLIHDITAIAGPTPYLLAQAIRPKIKPDAFDIFIEKLIDPNRESELGFHFGSSRHSLMLFLFLFRDGPLESQKLNKILTNTVYRLINSNKYEELTFAKDCLMEIPKEKRNEKQVLKLAEKFLKIGTLRSRSNTYEILSDAPVNFSSTILWFKFRFRDLQVSQKKFKDFSNFVFSIIIHTMSLVTTKIENFLSKIFSIFK